MPASPAKSMSLLWRILLSTSVAITLLFGLLGWVLQAQLVGVATLNLEQEVQTSVQAYDSLWRARAGELRSVSLVMSRMPQIRAAFGTRDAATVRDAAAEAWDGVSRPGTLFAVTDPGGSILSGVDGPAATDLSAAVRAASGAFPGQGSGFVSLAGRLYQIVLTPVYVQGGLLNVMAAGIAVDDALSRDLKNSTAGSDFVFIARGKVVASSLGGQAAQAIERGAVDGGSGKQIAIDGSRFYQFIAPLMDIEGRPVGELRILRSFGAAQDRIADMRVRLVVLWLAAIIAGIGLTYTLARRLLQPVKALDLAAAEVAKGNYDAPVPLGGGDELGRLADTFDKMREAIRSGREELIRQERISTIGRISASIVHDLRNPLAAIYGGSEMLVDSKLSPEQVRRLAGNIYRSSRQILHLLQELSDVTQGRAHAREVCSLREVVTAAYEPLASQADLQKVAVTIDVPEGIDLPLDRTPMERVFRNLLTNAMEAMPKGGSIFVHGQRRGSDAVVAVEDNGPGVPSAIAGQLFQPFVTAGKAHGLGLGLALSRKTVVSHGGDLWREDSSTGARFVLRLPA